MKLFKMTVANAPDSTAYAGTRAGAQAAAKAMPKPLWIDVLIQEVDVKTDKAGMVAALNGEAIETPTGASWTLASRGGLVAGK